VENKTISFLASVRASILSLVPRDIETKRIAKSRTKSFLAGASFVSGF
jgi:hypothetical protein